MTSTATMSLPQFIPNISESNQQSKASSPSAPSFVTDSSTIGLEPLGELDGTINNFAQNAKYNLANLNLRQLLSNHWSKLQSWGSFIDTSKMVLPVSIQQWSKRLVQNFHHFQSNYLFVFFILCIYCVLTSPLLLLVLAAISAAGYILTLKNAERPLKIMGYKLNLGQQYIALGICSIPFLWIVGAGSAVFWVIGASFFVIVLHASVYAIETIPQQPQALTEPYVFEVQSI
ncbi:prenylated Rab acceptor-like protein [Sarcoptes scabiei]|uniref:PRA1 family protein n=1 Tax=Sarcoptes scabiei TaxID=52283 RepID=A0A132AIQ0_SARSC|nr:prenylated Rab acceptor-like protein [Sarcoptes scabiei]